MPKVLMTVNLSAADYPEHPWCEGEIHHTDDELAAFLFSRGFAKAIPDTIKGVPRAPAIARPKRLDAPKPEIKSTLGD